MGETGVSYMKALSLIPYPRKITGEIDVSYMKARLIPYPRKIMGETDVSYMRALRIIHYPRKKNGG